MKANHHNYTYSGPFKPGPILGVCPHCGAHCFRFRDRNTRNTTTIVDPNMLYRCLACYRFYEGHEMLPPPQ
jgi:hypothetical protein